MEFLPSIRATRFQVRAKPNQRRTDILMSNRNSSNSSCSGNNNSNNTNGNNSSNGNNASAYAVSVFSII